MTTEYHAWKRAEEEEMGLVEEIIADFMVNNAGSIIVLYPQTEAARQWIDEHIGEDKGFQPWYPNVIVEPRYIEAILEGIDSDGLRFE